jgi:hypothetical protein
MTLEELERRTDSQQAEIDRLKKQIQDLENKSNFFASEEVQRAARRGFSDKAPE